MKCVRKDLLNGRTLHTYTWAKRNPWAIAAAIGFLPLQLLPPPLMITILSASAPSRQSRSEKVL